MRHRSRCCAPRLSKLPPAERGPTHSEKPPAVAASHHEQVELVRVPRGAWPADESWLYGRLAAAPPPKTIVDEPSLGGLAAGSGASKRSRSHTESCFLLFRRQEKISGESLILSYPTRGVPQ